MENTLEQFPPSRQVAELGTFDKNMQHGEMHWDDLCRLLLVISHSQPVLYDRDFRTALPHDQQRVLEVPGRTLDKATSKGDYDVGYRTIGAEDGAVRWVKAKCKVYFET